MVSGHWITRRAEMHRRVRPALLVGFLALGLGLAQAQTAVCDKPLYLTFDTGHMEVAPLVADVLARQHVLVTFFAAHERSKAGDGSLGNYWAPWWKARAAEGHAFASHTWDHVYWRGDVAATPGRFRVRPSAGPDQGREFTWTGAQYCEQIG